MRVGSGRSLGVGSMQRRPASLFKALITAHPRFNFLVSKRARARLDPITRIEFGLHQRPHYAYIVFQACVLARALGLRRISALEFGVAGGNGLVQLETLAAEIGTPLGIEIEVYGFDLGEGMPEPVDYRDCPHLWRHGFYKMDQAALEARLKKARLAVGPVRETVATFATQFKPAPIGAIAFDLDYYSSTADAFGIFSLPPAFRLPRIYCYLDDIIGVALHALSDFTGELLALHEFNQRHDQMKLSPDRSLLRQLSPAYARWRHQVYIQHDFAHPDYTRFIGTKNDQRPLQ